MRAAHGILAFIFMALSPFMATGAMAQAREIVTTQNSDYFGFDLRTEQNLSLDRCKSICLGDSSCRAFTYNTKAKWCFLKSDFNTLKQFNGAVAGKVVSLNGDADIGAPAALTFVPDWMVAEAQNYRRLIVNPLQPVTEGLNTLVDGGDSAMLTGDPRTAMQKYRSALAIAPDDAAIWIGLSLSLIHI